jgi:hypothetical protein
LAIAAHRTILFCIAATRPAQDVVVVVADQHAGVDWRPFFRLT